MGYGGGGSGGGGSGGSGGGGGGSYTTVGGGSAFGGSDDFELPSYNQAPAGSIRFNTDSKKLEVYILGPVGITTLPNGIWMEVDSWSPELQTGGTRGINSNANPGNATIEYINIDSTGNAIDFGDRTVGAEAGQNACSSRTRALIGGGEVPGGNTNVIDYVTISSTGNAVFFGYLTLARGAGPSSISNSTRGIWAGGRTPTPQVIMDYVTIAQTGDAVDFGDLSAARNWVSGCGSQTRGLFMGGSEDGGSTFINTIEHITISTLGNAADFGDTQYAAQVMSSASNSIRGIVSGGQAVSGPTTVSVNTINYITIATLGDAVDFGDLTNIKRGAGGMSSKTRAVFAAGFDPGTSNIIDYVQIMSTGDAIDFGDATNTRFGGGTSNGHGGL